MVEDIPTWVQDSLGPALGDHAYTVAEQMGATMVRSHLGRDAGFDWAQTDAFVDRAVSRGFEPYLTLTYRRRYRDGPDPGFLGVPGNLEFGAWCAEAARRYAGRVRHFGVWNEPNYFGDGLTEERYNGLYRSCKAAIDANAPGARVYYGEVAADDRSTDPCGWVRRSLAAGPVVADGLAIHTYQWTSPPETRVAGPCSGIGRLGDWTATAGEWRRDGLLVGRAGGSVPLLVTEHGYCAEGGACPTAASTGNGLPERRRAAYAWRAYRWAAAHGVEVFGYYHLVKQPATAGLWNTGVLERDGSPTASVGALRAAVGGPPRDRPARRRPGV